MPCTTYASSGDVADFLRIGIDETTSPNITQIEKIIVRKEEILDRRTGHTYGRSKTISQEIHDVPLVYTYGWGSFITLQHREVKFDACNPLLLCTCAGDKLEIWNGHGSCYTCIGDAGNRYQMIPGRGEIYVRGLIFSILRKNRFRITYRYGSTTVPGDVEDAIVKMTCIDVLKGSLKMDVVPFGGAIKPMELIRGWEDDIDQVVRNREEVFFIP